MTAAAAGRPLVPSPARDVDGAGSRKTAEEATDRRVRMPGRADVGIVEHGVAKAADQPVRVWSFERFEEPLLSTTGSALIFPSQSPETKETCRSDGVLRQASYGTGRHGSCFH